MKDHTVDLADVLRDYHRRAPEGSKTIAIHYFGVKFADLLTPYSTPQLRQLASRAGLPESYGDELYKMRRLAPYIAIVRPFPA